MTTFSAGLRRMSALALATLLVTSANAAEIGQIKVSNGQVTVERKGESQPVADNRTAEGRQKNRRVEVEIIGTRTVRR